MENPGLQTQSGQPNVGMSASARTQNGLWRCQTKENFEFRLIDVLHVANYKALGSAIHFTYTWMRC